MRRNLVTTTLLLALALGFSGCGEQLEAPTKQEATSSQRYEVRGTVISINREAKEVIVQHEKIVDLMEAMRMGFSVPDASDLEKLEAGKLIKATLVVDNNMMWLEDVDVQGDAPATALSDGTQ